MLSKNVWASPFRRRQNQAKRSTPFQKRAVIISLLRLKFKNHTAKLNANLSQLMIQMLDYKIGIHSI